MSRAWFVVAIVVGLGLFFLGAGLQSNSHLGAAFGQDGRGSPSAIGRYQIAVSSGTAERSGVLVVCDTTTGQCWQSARSTTVAGGRGGGDVGGFPGGLAGGALPGALPPGGAFPARSGGGGSRWRDLGTPGAPEARPQPADQR